MFNKNMLTTKDIDKLMAVFATKHDLEELERRMEEKFATKEDHDRVMNLVDKVLGEVKAMREEQAAHQLAHDDIQERFAKIETTSAVTHRI